MDTYWKCILHFLLYAGLLVLLGLLWLGLARFEKWLERAGLDDFHAWLLRMIGGALGIVDATLFLIVAGWGLWHFGRLLVPA